MAEKNYTQEQVDRMVAVYGAAETEEQREKAVHDLADELDKTVRSIRAKLVREGVYIAKSYKSKTGEKPETKAEIVDAIAGFLGVDSDRVGSLEKATKGTLKLIRGTLQRLPSD